MITVIYWSKFLVELMEWQWSSMVANHRPNDLLDKMVLEVGKQSFVPKQAYGRRGFGWNGS